MLNQENIEAKIRQEWTTWIFNKLTLRKGIDMIAGILLGAIFWFEITRDINEHPEYGIIAEHCYPGEECSAFGKNDD